MLRLGLLARGLKLPRGLIAHHTPAFCSFGSLPHEELRSDVKLLGKALGSVIRATPGSGEDTFRTVEALRSLAKDWRGSEGGDEKLRELIALSSSLDPKSIREVSRAFAHFLALANAAESHHRIRRLRERQLEVEAGSGNSGGQPAALNSVKGSVQALLAGQGKFGAVAASPEEIFEALSTQCVEIVLTAHPTEVNRRAVIRKHRRIDEILTSLDRPNLLAWERKEQEDALTRQVEALWFTDEIRRDKPTPVKEATQGLDILESSLWQSVPAYLRRVDADLLETPGIGKRLPPDAAPVKFSSWMGGDRDGNPNVTASVTKEVSRLSRLRGAELAKHELRQVALLLTVDASKATPELLALVPKEHAGTPVPYVKVLEHLAARLDATTNMLEAGHLKPQARSVEAVEAGSKGQPLVSTEELVGCLLTAHASLCKHGLATLADGMLRDLIRQVKCFGLCLLPLDVRNESVRHSEALDAITKLLGHGRYLEWDEETRMAWLLKELNDPRPLLPKRLGSEGYAALGPMFTPAVCDVLETFDLIAEMPTDGLGAYVISMAQTPSDVLAVRLLQKEAGVEKPMRVAPLFETLQDLENSTAVMKTLWQLPWYQGDTGSTQEVMLGYSDSAKDAGRIAAAWAQYRAQELLVAAAKEHGVDLNLFHGKGGTASRGGDPSTFRAIAAQPPGTVSGRFRITEQGEIITQNYAHPDMAARHLNVYTAALLYEKFLPSEPRKPLPQYRALMDAMSETSCAAYRKVVREDARFIPYFRSATPELEIAALNVGSRPAKRRPTGGVETLRAIPWVFAWTQTRLNLTAWLGMGPALGGLDQAQRDVLKEMHRTWPWFGALVDVVDMVMAKTEPAIAANYDAQLVEPKDQQALGKELRQEQALTRKELLSLRGYTRPQEENDMLQRGLKVRNPYVDPLNVLQAEVLKRLRAGQFKGSDEKAHLEDALAITINGVANGQKNTG